MSVGLYEAVFDGSIQYNIVVAIANDSLPDFDTFVSDWLNKDVGILSIVNLSMAKQAFGDTIASLNIVVLVMLLSAGALAFVVIYNLTNINISERLREIATIKVLGFTHRETNMYIFRENLLMGIAGILIGSVAGYFLAKFMIATIEVDFVMFYKKIDITSFLFAALLTAFYIGFVNLVMTRRIKNISMVESLRRLNSRFPYHFTQA
jgi:putative ABC transport system permease protein